MPSGFHTWSQTGATNSTADSGINWAEGQAPSSVNDSARNEMAVLAKWRDDNNGSLTTGGTTTALTITSNTVFTTLALMHNQTLAFTMNATSGATPTLNVDSLGAKVIRNATGVALPTGALLSGSVYEATYNNTSGEWLLHNQPGVLPTSSVITASIADDAITFAKLQNSAGSTIIGKNDAGSGDFKELTLDTTLAFSGTTVKVNPSTGLTAALAVDYASKAEQQAGSSAVKTVNPLHQQDHASAAKAWLKFASSGTDISQSYNVASMLWSGSNLTVTFTTAFSSSSFVCIVGGNATKPSAYVVSQTASTVVINATDGATGGVFSGSMVCFGIQ